MSRAAKRPALAVAYFTTGLLLGAVVTTSFLWLMSGIGTGLSEAVVMTLVFVAAALVVFRDFGLVKLAIPGPRRQVPSSVFRLGLNRAALIFGFEMGTGVRTYITGTVPYLAALVIVLMGQDLLDAIAVGLGFAMGRAFIPFWRVSSRDRDRWLARLNNGALKLRAITGVSAAFVSVVITIS